MVLLVSCIVLRASLRDLLGETIAFMEKFVCNESGDMTDQPTNKLASWLTTERCSVLTIHSARVDFYYNAMHGVLLQGVRSW